MTNTELAKALECCFVQNGNCRECPMYKYEVQTCSTMIIKLAIGRLRDTEKADGKAE